MAIAQEQLASGGARIYRFPAERVAGGPSRRRRVAVSALAAVVLAGLVWVSAPGATATPAAPRRSHVTVRAGDSLWEIAVRFAPLGSDPRAFVDAIQKINRLSGPLQPGTRLRLPK